jgi:hypothetical protein
MRRASSGSVSLGSGAEEAPTAAVLIHFILFLAKYADGQEEV